MEAESFNLGLFCLRNPGLIVGFILVVVATVFLPARVRWYVLTAGLAVVFYRTYQLISADKRLKEADAERQRLRGELDKLGQERITITKDLDSLNADLEKVKTQQSELARRAKTLDTKGEALAEGKAALDEAFETLLEKDQSLMAEIGARESALSLFDKAEQAFKTLETAARDTAR